MSLRPVAVHGPEPVPGDAFASISRSPTAGVLGRGAAKLQRFPLQSCRLRPRGALPGVAIARRERCAGNPAANGPVGAEFEFLLPLQSICGTGTSILCDG